MEKKEKYSNCCPDCWNSPFAVKTRFKDGICGIACDTCTHGNFEREPVGSNWCMCGKEWRGLRYHNKGHGKKIIVTPAPEDWKENFDQFLLGKYENGIQVPRTREEWIGFISNLLTAERDRNRAEVVENLEDLTYAIQMENKGNKSYMECKCEAYQRLLTTD